MNRKKIAFIALPIIIVFFISCTKELALQNPARPQNTLSLADTLQSIRDHFNVYDSIPGTTTAANMNIKLDSVNVNGTNCLPTVDSLYMLPSYAYLQYGNQRVCDALYTWPQALNLTPSNAWAPTPTCSSNGLMYGGTLNDPTPNIKIYLYLNGVFVGLWNVSYIRHLFTYNCPVPPNYRVDVSSINRIYLHS